MVALRVVVLVSVIVGIPHFASSAAARYVQIAHTPGVPYRSFQVEYPIVELGLIEATAFGSLATARALLGVVAFLGDMLAFLSVRARAGERAGRRYLLLGTPLLLYIYRRSDLVSVGLAALGVVLADRGRGKGGGAAFAGAILAKLWPIVLLPAWLLQRRTSALRACAVVLVAGVGLWIALGGWGAPGQVVTFRGATGWEVESSVGAVVWVLTNERRFEAGAVRTGTITSAEHVALLVILVALLVAIWRRAWSTGQDPWGVPAAASVAALLVTSPLLSPPYVAWLLPWLAFTTRRRTVLLGTIPIALTGAVVAVWYLGIGRGHPGVSQTMLIARNLALVPLVGAAFVRDRGAPRGAESGSAPVGGGS
ncbi:MAG: hypothetical protein ACM3OO_00195 [Planctomycetaceae bacterium]